jgi:hypothetical protein
VVRIKRKKHVSQTNGNNLNKIKIFRNKGREYFKNINEVQKIEKLEV